jgi:hypothetical protein
MHLLLLHRGALVTLALLTLPVMHAQLGPAPAPSTASAAAMSWHGRYTNNSITLELKAMEGTVSGLLHFDGQAHRVVVHPIGNKLYGEVRINADATTFEASREGEILRCVIGGTTLQLKRVANATTARTGSPGGATPASAPVARSAPAPAPPAPPIASPPSADTGPLADPTPLAQRWLTKLRGKVVRQFWASQGMSSDKRHLLNADGTYAYKSASMVSVDAGGASGLSTGRGNTAGRWRIRDDAGKVFLEVTYTNGEVKRMRITEDNRNWYLNGEKAFAVAP